MPIDLRTRLTRTAPDTESGDTLVERRALATTDWSVTRSTTPEFVVAAAREQEEAGFDGVLVPERSGWPDVYAISSWMLAHTSTLKTVAAHRIGRQSPTTVARLAQTVDLLSEGRFIHHFLTGHNEQDQQRDGDFVDKPGRYRRAGEFLDVYVREFVSHEPFDHEGEFYSVRGAQSGVGNVSDPYSEISWAGSSEAGIAVAAQYANTFALPAEPLEGTIALRSQVERVAAGHGRSLRYWLNANLILGRTDDIARKLAEDVAKYLDDRPSLLKLDITKPESVSRRRIAGLADRSDWADDALFLGLARITGVESVPSFVGSPETVSKAILRYYEQGVEIFGLDPRNFSHEELELQGELVRRLRQGAAEIDARALVASR